ncbi:hypothetical protein AVEN_169550-1 [Araneus ventricosus]|uniref:Uncharacterized protein n=1 Tax=Araneus ventricosus TaxID=182803 RepID=A0A4Y2N878_ARAVE|nr:hypothetical protein AVEN_169550-1 [Araneus ventricosus]
MGCTPPKAGVECNFLCPKVGSLGLVAILTLELLSRGFEIDALNIRCAHGPNAHSLCWGQLPLVAWCVSLEKELPDQKSFSSSDHSSKL